MSSLTLTRARTHILAGGGIGPLPHRVRQRCGEGCGVHGQPCHQLQIHGLFLSSAQPVPTVQVCGSIRACGCMDWRGQLAELLSVHACIYAYLGVCRRRVRSHFCHCPRHVGTERNRRTHTYTPRHTHAPIARTHKPTWTRTGPNTHTHFRPNSPAGSS